MYNDIHGHIIIFMGISACGTAAYHLYLADKNDKKSF